LCLKKLNNTALGKFCDALNIKAELEIVAGGMNLELANRYAVVFDRIALIPRFRCWLGERDVRFIPLRTV